MNGKNRVPDLAAAAEVREAALAARALSAVTGGPARPCSTPLPHGQGIAWPGVALCDLFAMEYLRYAPTRAPESLAQEAAKFGLAYVRARDEAIETEMKARVSAAEIRGAAGGG